MIRRILVVGVLAAATALAAIAAAGEELGSNGFDDACGRQERILVMLQQIDPFKDYDVLALSAKFSSEVTALQKDADLIQNENPAMADVLRRQAGYLFSLADALQNDPGTKELPSEALRVARDGVRSSSAALADCSAEGT